MTYRIVQIIKHSEAESWEDGCMSETSETEFIDSYEHGSTFKTTEECIKWIKDFTGVKDTNAFSMDSCDEVGRIDVQYNAVTRTGKQAQKGSIDKWKDGKRIMYLVDCSFYIEEISSPATAEWVI